MPAGRLSFGVEHPEDRAVTTDVDSPGSQNGSEQETCQQRAVNQTHYPPSSALLVY